MSTLITKYPVTTPGDATVDPRLRKTFTYLETNWHDEMNNNWLQTVDQLNTLADTLTATNATLTTAEASLALRASEITTLQTSVAAKASTAFVTAFQNALSLCELGTGVSAGVTALTVTLTQFDAKSGDVLVAFDPSNNQRTEMTLTADVTTGSTALAIEALAADLTAGSIIFMSQGTLRLLSTGSATELSALEASMDANAASITALQSSLSANANSITLWANRVQQVESDLDTFETSLTASISVNAAAIALRATSTTVSALDGRVTTAEGSITTNATGVALNASGLTTVNNTVTAQAASIAVERGRIDTVVSDFGVLDTAVDNLTTTVTQSAADIVLHAQRLDDTEGSIVGHTALINVNASGITQRVTKANFTKAMQGTAFTQLAGAVDTGVGTTSALTVDPITPDNATTGDVVIKSGTVIIVVDAENTADPYEFTVSADVLYNASSIPVTAAPLDAADNSPLYISTQYVASEMIQTAEKIGWAIYKRNADSPAGDAGKEVITAFGLELDGIHVEADSFASQDFYDSGGSVDGAGAPVYTAATTGWALTKDGSLFANNSILRGSLNFLIPAVDKPGALTIDTRLNDDGLLLPLKNTASGLLATDPQILLWKDDAAHQTFMGGFYNTNAAAYGGVKSVLGLGGDLVYVTADMEVASELFFGNNMTGSKYSNAGVNLDGAGAAADFTVVKGSNTVNLIAFYNGLHHASTGLVTTISSADQATNAHSWDTRWLTRGYAATQYREIDQSNVADSNAHFLTKTQLDAQFYRQDDAALEARLALIEAKINELAAFHSVTPIP